MPAEFEAAPITRFLSAKELIDNRQYKKARAACADMFEDGAYKNLSAEHAIFLLAAYARSVKLCLRSLTVSDWQEIYRALYVVDRDYHDKNSDAEQHRRDLAAAQRQIEKLGGTVPEL